MVFLKSVDASDAIKDANLIFKLLDEVVEEVGEDIVVQVVTDNASNYKLAGKKLMEKRTRLWWTPCASHCIDLMLEKIESLPQHKNALLKAKKRKHAGRDLLRPAATRFATAYLTLQSILDMRQPLESMFASVEWSQSSYSRKDEGKAVKKIIFDRAFWLSVAYAIKTTKPLVQVLRMTDSEKMPEMGFSYGEMDKAKEEIAKNLGREKGSYKKLWNIIDEKWEFQMHRHLHAAAYFLNPHFQYDDGFSSHVEVKSGLYACLEKLIPNESDREKADLQLDFFRKRDGLFRCSLARSSCKKRSPRK
ncbi:hypothetical protein PHJA_001387300 [Phtheirospermum japonicum]|uniref:DUF659 domain-containing protein n=1 Tax=Phtheirospermum japonicum TaxID=374723 RepID=A0A830CDS2_9LAMI|nr:hypothetical protein PHJA_001387300 [Phtheirospermum japonicum]